MAKSTTVSKTNNKDVVFIGANVLDSGCVYLIGFSIPRLLPLLIDTEEMMSTRVLNPKDYDDIPTYHNGVLKFNKNTLMFIGKFMTGYLFADGEGKLFCFEFNEVLRLKENGNITFKGCKIVAESAKQKGSIKFSNIPGITIEKLRCGEQLHESLIGWETYVHDTHRYYGKYCYMYSILERVFTAFINKLDLMVALGYYNESKIKRGILLKNARIMSFANEYFYKNNMELNLVAGYIQPNSSIAYLKLDVAKSLTYALGKCWFIQIYERASCGKVISEIDLSCDKQYMMYLHFRDVDKGQTFKISVTKFEIDSDGKEYIKFICDCESPDDSYMGLHIEIQLYADDRSSISVSMAGVQGSARGYRKGFEDVVGFYYPHGLEEYQYSFFNFESFVDKELALKHKIYNFRRDFHNRNHPELKNYLGIQGFEVEALMNEVKTDKQPGKLNFLRLVQLNRYEFIKIYQYSTKSTNMYVELYIGGKVVCGCTFDNSDEFDYMKVYRNIAYIAKWHIELEEQNYNEYVSGLNITLDNRWYELDFLRPIKDKIQVVIMEVFGFCIVQDVFTGIYFLSFMVKPEKEREVYSAVMYREHATMAFVKMCAFKDRNYAVGFMGMLYKYIEKNKYDVNGLRDVYNKIHESSYALKKSLFMGYEQDLDGSVALSRWVCRALGGYGDSHELIREISGSSDIRGELGIIS